MCVCARALPDNSFQLATKHHGHNDTPVARADACSANNLRRLAGNHTYDTVYLTRNVRVRPPFVQLHSLSARRPKRIALHSLCFALRFAHSTHTHSHNCHYYFAHGFVCVCLCGGCSGSDVLDLPCAFSCSRSPICIIPGPGMFHVPPVCTHTHTTYSPGEVAPDFRGIAFCRLIKSLHAARSPPQEMRTRCAAAFAFVHTGYDCGSFVCSAVFCMLFPMHAACKYGEWVLHLRRSVGPVLADILWWINVWLSNGWGFLSFESVITV